MRLRIVAAAGVVTALIPAWAGATRRAAAQPARPPAFSADLTHAAVRRVMTAAADWQLAHPSEHAPYDWTVAAFYTGMMAFATLAGMSGLTPARVLSIWFRSWISEPNVLPALLISKE